MLTTSNITEAIDLAFVDRADIKAYIGNPNEQARWGRGRMSAYLVAAGRQLHAWDVALTCFCCQNPLESKGAVRELADPERRRLQLLLNMHGRLQACQPHMVFWAM